MKFGVMSSGQVTGAEIERLGFDSAWVGDHVFFRVPTAEALTALAFLAGSTSRIALGTAVLQLPMRHPALVAKSFATLQHLTGGRMVLGAGVGGDYAPEFEALAVPVRERGRRTDEGLEVIRRLFTGEPVDYAGRYYRLDGVRLQPAPAPPPILIGGRTDAALRRAARYGDGYFPYLTSPEQVARRLATIRELALAAGRPRALDAGCALLVFVGLDEDAERGRQTVARYLQRLYAMPFEEIVGRYAVAGNPETCAARFVEFAAAGVTHFACILVGDPDSPGRSLDLLARTVELARGREPVTSAHVNDYGPPV